MVKIAALITVLVLAGCQAGGGSYCDVAEPIRLSSGAVDALDDRDVNAVLRHNETGAKLCGW